MAPGRGPQLARCTPAPGSPGAGGPTAHHTLFVCFGCYATLLYFATQLLQLVGDYAPLRAGLALVPLAVASALGAVLAPRLAAWWTYRWGIAGSLAVFGAAAYRVLLPALPAGADARSGDSFGATLEFADSLGPRAEAVR